MMITKRFIEFAVAVLLILMTIPSVGVPQKSGASEPEVRHRDFYLAYRMYQDKLYDVAASEFLEFARNNPGHVNSGEALFLAGESFFQIGEYDRARAAYLSCAIEYPLDSRVISALIQAAACWEAMKQPYQAGDAYYRVYMQFPNSDQAPEVLLKAGNAYLEADSLPQARNMFETFLDRFSGHPNAIEATLTLAEIVARVGSMAGAEAMFSQALATATVDSVKEKILWRWFQTVYRQGDLVAALKVGDQLIAGFPKSRLIPSVQRSLGELALRADDAAEAEKRLTEALKSKDAAKDTRWLRAIARWQRGNWDGVLEDLGNDSTVAGQLMMGMTLQAKGEPDRARSIYVDCVRRDWGGPYGLKALEQLSVANTILTSEEFKKLPGINTLADSANFGLWIRYWLQVIPGDKIYPDEGLVADLIQNPRNPYADDVLYSRGGWNLRRGAWEAAYQDFSLLPVKFPSSEWVVSSGRIAEALQYAAVPTADRFEVLGDLLAGQALNTAQVSINNIAWCYFHKFKDYDKAEQWFQKTLAAKSSPPEQTFEARLGSTLSTLYQLRLDMWIGKAPKEQKPDSLVAAAFSHLEGSEAAAKFRPIIEQAVLLFQEDFQQKSLPVNPIIQWITVPRDSSFSSARFPSFRPLLIRYHLNRMTTDPRNAHKQAALVSLNESITIGTKPEEVRWAKWEKANLLIADTTSNIAVDLLKDLARNPGPYQVEAALVLAEYLPTPEERIPYLVFAREKVPYHRDFRNVCLRLGDQYFLAKRYEDALKAFSEVEESETLTSDPFVRFTLTSDDLEYKLGSAYRALGRHDEALVHFRRYLMWHRYGPTAEAALYALGRTEEDRGFPMKALDYYRHLHRFFAKSDYDRLGMIRIGEILWDAEDYSGAAKVYEELRSQLPTSEDAVKWEQRRIICLYRSGNMTSGDAAKAQFEKDYKKHAEFDILNAELELESGKALAQAKRPKDAEKVFDRLAKRCSGTSMGAQASYELGKLKLKGEKPDDGLEILTKMPAQYAKDPVLPEVYVTLGVFYYQNQQFENALGAFQNALAAVQGEPKILKDVLNNLVVAYRDLGMWEAALAALERSLSLFPEDDNVTRRLEQGQFFMHIGETDRAIELLKKQLSRARGDELLAVQFYIGEAYFQKGMYAKAAAEYMKVVYADVTAKLDWVVTAIYQAGQSYERLGKPEKAIEMYRDIIKRQGRESPYSRGAQTRIDELQQRESLLRSKP